VGVVPGVGVCVWLGVGVPDGDGLAVRVGLAVREGLGDRDGVGTGEDLTGGAGVVDVGAGFACRVCCTMPADTGRTRMYSASTARNSPIMTRVEVRGRAVTARSRSRGRCRVRR
jgi:hypothetical protein